MFPFISIKYQPIQLSVFLFRFIKICIFFFNYVYLDFYRLFTLKFGIYILNNPAQSQPFFFNALNDESRSRRYCCHLSQTLYV